MVQPLGNYKNKIKEIFGDYNIDILTYIHQKLNELGYKLKPTVFKNKEGKQIYGYDNLNKLFKNGVIEHIAERYEKPKRDSEDDIEWKTNINTHTMDDANGELLDKYQFENKKVVRITESQYNKLLELIK